MELSNESLDKEAKRERNLRSKLEEEYR